MKKKNYVKTNIIYCCYLNHITEEELRLAIGASKDAYYNAKFPWRKTPTLKKIAEYFGYTVDEFWNINLIFSKSIRFLDDDKKREEFIRTSIKNIKNNKLLFMLT